MRALLIALLLFPGSGANIAIYAQTPEWRTVAVPGSTTTNAGFAWFRCFVKLPAEWQGRDLTFAVEAIGTAHEAYLNGAKIGGAGKFPPNYQDGSDAGGRYALPPDKTRFNDWNLIAIRVYDHDREGPFHGAAPLIGTDKQHITLAGQWEFMAGDDLTWARVPADRRSSTRHDPAAPPDAGSETGAPTHAAFANIEDGPAPKPSSGHKMSDRATPLPPAEAARTFVVPEDLEIEQVLAEPDIAQPVFLNFDTRGRMWVVEYRQYPAPAGLKVVSHDNFWRAVYDRVPEPPPRGPRGLDRITIHEDTDGNGAYDKHKTFIDGLNIVTSCVKDRDGLWVLNPPYLLFYPDKNEDDIPDGDPIVHLEGFGLEDTHSVVNSLCWGPDGWLYAAQGSTVTANVSVRSQGIPSTAKSITTTARSTRPGGPPVYSQGQCIWRYHPARHIYEIFAEGGGNAFGVEFDDKGRVFSGHNGGNTRGFHYMQGAYLQKGFEKHGELSNPYAFGYFPQMDGTKGERFSHTFLIYHGGALPSRYEGKLFGCEPLQGRVVLSEITPVGSTFKTRDLERVVTSSDSWFRPVDIKAGPDGAIYIADWYDRQVTHTRNQEGNIDPSNGRIYRLKEKGAKALRPLDLGKLSSGELVGLLDHSNSWMRQSALLALRQRGRPEDAQELAAQIAIINSPVSAPAPDPADKNAVADHGATRSRLHHALDYFWAHARATKTPALLLEQQMDSSFAATRFWAIRLIGDEGHVSSGQATKLSQLALREADIEVRAQLACTAKRLPGGDALSIVHNLVTSSPRQVEDTSDPRLPLLLWWAIESKCDTDRDAVLALFDDSTFWTRPIVEQHLLERLMRRFAAAGTRTDMLACAKLLNLSPSRRHSEILMKGFEEAFKGRSLAGLPEELVTAMARHQVGSDAFKLRAGDTSALTLALSTIVDPKARKERRKEFIDVLGEVRPPSALDSLLRVADDEPDPLLRKAALTALLGYDDPRIAATVLKDYNAYAPEVRSVALTLLASRAPGSLALANAVDSGKIKPSDVPLEAVRRLQLHQSETLARLIPKLWPNAGRPTTETMQLQIQRLGGVLRAGKGDPYAGQKLFNSTCASCHTLFARGGHVGPDLTTYRRGDVEALLLHIVNPSAEIREGFENVLIETRDDRSLTGFLVERDPRIVVLRGLDGQNIVLEQKNIVEMRAAGLSLMPEGLLDAMTEQQARDLFAYLRSTQPLANGQ